MLGVRLDYNKIGGVSGGEPSGGIASVASDSSDKMLKN